MIGLLYIAPLIALMLALWSGRYPGEAIVVRAARLRRARVQPAPPPARAVLGAGFGARGGALLAHALGKRGPPAGRFT